jgi:broad-specificity NMP kinase
MSFIYVTGAPGVGKSTLQKELSNRGLEVYDIDDSELGGAHNKASGKRVNIPAAKERAPEWFNEHEWRIDRKAIEVLKNKAIDTDVIICVIAPEDESILPLFDKIFYLKLDDDDLRQRIASRIDNDYGKNSNELLHILERKKKLDARYINIKAIMINATESPSEIANHIQT